MTARARLLSLLALVAIASAVVVVSGLAGGTSRAGADNTARVDVIFDSAKGIIPGQLVKVAGARVGTIKDVVLTPDFKARIEMELESRFTPFRKDASCEIKPEGLISERFVQCDPGTPSAPELVGKNGEAPTVPVDRTTVPVSLTDLFNIWQVPVADRFTVVINELGLAGAGRGEDINAVLRRANPTLGLVRRVLDEVKAQKQQLASAVVSTEKVARALAVKPQRVSDFIDRAAAVSTQFGLHRGALAEGVKRLPALLDATKPALTKLDTVAREGTPLVRDLGIAAPDITHVIDRLGPAAKAGTPALKSLGGLATIGIKTATDSGSTVKALAKFSAIARPVGTQLAGVLTSLRDSGFTEHFMGFLYYIAAATARYDSTSHLLGSHLFNNNSQCGSYATTPVDGCSANFHPTASTRAIRALPETKSGHKVAGPSHSSAPDSGSTTGTTGGGSEGTTSPSPSGGVTVHLPGLPPITVPSPQTPLGGPGGNSGGSSTPIGKLLGGLLG